MVDEAVELPEEGAGPGIVREGGGGEGEGPRERGKKREMKIPV